MSWEGYYQFLCEDGHLSEHDGYAQDPTTCRCGKRIKQWHQVDLTNGCEEEGHVKDAEFKCPAHGWELQLLNADATHTCSCGNTHRTEEERYEVIQR